MPPLRPKAHVGCTCSELLFGAAGWRIWGHWGGIVTRSISVPLDIKSEPNHQDVGTCWSLVSPVLQPGRGSRVWAFAGQMGSPDPVRARERVSVADPIAPKGAGGGFCPEILSPILPTEWEIRPTNYFWSGFRRGPNGVSDARDLWASGRMRFRPASQKIQGSRDRRSAFAFFGDPGF